MMAQLDSPNRSIRTALAAPLVLLTMLLLLVTLLTGAPAARAADPVSPESPFGAPLVPNPDTSRDRDIPTRLRISSFNLLGHSHTVPGARKGWANSTQRTIWAAQLIRKYRLDVVGLQELQWPQYQEWERQFGRTHGIFPGNQYGAGELQNSIMWDKSKWTVVRKRRIAIPYFKGTPIKMPYIMLRNNATGRLIWVYNGHNPANTAGPAQAHRDAGFALEAQLVRILQAHSPGVPVFSLGDKNDRAKYFCNIASKTYMRSANGGLFSGGRCTPPARMGIDWVMGSPQVNFSGYTSVRDSLVKKTTDHPIVFADALMQSDKVANSGVKQVVSVNVEGLRASELTAANSLTPWMRQLARSGTSTPNARALPDRITSMANAVGIITGQPALKSRGGTGVTAPGDRGGSIHRAAGRYVASALDTVHDAGRRASVFGSNATLIKRVKATWNGKHGATDKVAHNNGSDKINTLKSTRSDRAAMNAAIAELARKRTAYTSVTMSAPDTVAMKYGASSKRYQAALRSVDSYVGKLVRTINNNPALARQTVIIITAGHGAVSKSRLSGTALAAYRVPFVVWGAKVRRGANIYALNPWLRSPGTARTTFSGPQPVRNADAANLATKLLGLPAVRGSRVGAAQNLTVF